MAENKPKLIVIAGPNGSGKTSVTSQILKHEWLKNFAYINPDNIAQEQFGDWNSPEAVLKAAQFSPPQYFTYFSDISPQLQTTHS